MNALGNTIGGSRSQAQNEMPVQRQARRTLAVGAVETVARCLEARLLDSVSVVAIELLISEPVEYDGCDAEHASFVAFAVGRRHALYMAPRNCSDL